QVTVPRLLQAIAKKDVAALLAVVRDDGDKEFSKADALDLLKTLGEAATLFQLERCEVEDRPRITVTKKIANPSGSPKVMSKDFSKLSLGQQQSVLLALMLSSDSNAPLIIDQPEDNLDGEFIFYSLVPALRQAKERRQVIIVTHNANIAVLGDAEQIIALKSTSDNGQIVARGSIDDPATRKIVCQILEGAEEAFKKRANIYGLL
ncbi:MAG: AAA family ATPase, partial [Blastocatellia bacterium]